MKNEKNVLVIGASSDIAIALSKKFASHGFNLQLAARKKSHLDKQIQFLSQKYHIKINSHELDIFSEKRFKEFILSLDALPDVVIMTVGMLGNQKNDEQSIEKTQLIFRANFEGPSLFLTEIANHFESRRSGTIIAISSVAGERGRASNYIYGSAKAGFSAFLSGLRARLNGSNVHVITVLPGFVDTKMTKNLKISSFLKISPEKLANIIFNSYQKKREVTYSGIFWRIIMLIIKVIPEKIFKKIKF